MYRLLFLCVFFSFFLVFFTFLFFFFVLFVFFFFFSSRRRHTRSSTVSWARYSVRSVVSWGPGRRAGQTAHPVPIRSDATPAQCFGDLEFEMGCLICITDDYGNQYQYRHDQAQASGSDGATPQLAL